MIRIKFNFNLICYLIVCIVLTYTLYYKNPGYYINQLNRHLNKEVHTKLEYHPKGYIYAKWNPGGLNNQLEQLWFLNLLSQETRRGLVEVPLRLEDRDDSSKVNISELVNRDKYLKNLPTIQIQDFYDHCGPSIDEIKMPQRDWFREDELTYLINRLRADLGHCVVIEHFPSYDFYARPQFVDWIPALIDRVLVNFEFSDLIQHQVNYYVKMNDLLDGHYLSVQFRRGDFVDHCKVLFDQQYMNWSFGHLYQDQMEYAPKNWTKFESHCYPTVERMIAEIVAFNAALPKPVTKVLFLTNANHSEISALQTGLKNHDLEFIRFEPNMDLVDPNITWTITHSLAVEMELAKFGQFFIGNRHSSISSNIIGMKLHHFKFENNSFI